MSDKKKDHCPELLTTGYCHFGSKCDYKHNKKYMDILKYHTMCLDRIDALEKTINQLEINAKAQTDLLIELIKMHKVPTKCVPTKKKE